MPTLPKTQNLLLQETKVNNYHTNNNLRTFNLITQQNINNNEMMENNLLSI
jgi:hypothetical protein